MTTNKFEDALRKAGLDIMVFDADAGGRRLYKVENNRANLGAGPELALAAALLDVPVHKLVELLQGGQQ